LGCFREKLGFCSRVMDGTTMEPLTTCPECGAPTVDGLSCWEQLGAILAWEWQDPELLAEHFLTVASYNLQHPAQFTDAAMDGLRAAFIDHLDRGTPVATLRRRVSQFAEGSPRVLKDEAERRPVLRAWAMTIADVYLPDQPTGAADRVRRWAAAIRAAI
jgi:hypothetical protein